MEKLSLKFFQNVARISNCSVHNKLVGFFFLLYLNKGNADPLKAFGRGKLFYSTVHH